jgi:UDP-N-acetylmuramoyl-tripeptide--D-alanyl-D-alanine ligase
MGARRMGDIKEICDIVKPEIGILPSIGYQHLETMGSIENVIKTKFELIDSLPGDGLCFLNYDNGFITGREVANVSKTTYGIENDTDYRTSNIGFSGDGTTFTVTAPNGERQEYTTEILGKHNVSNITVAVAVAHKLGISLAELKPAVRRLKGVEHRLQLRRSGNLSIIDDSYNSNLEGAKSALECLSGFGGEKVLITPGMVELGDMQAEMNFAFGAAAADVCGLVVLIGRGRTADIRAGLVSKDYPEDKIVIKESFKEGFAVAEEMALTREVAVLIENDLPDNYF